LSRKEEELYKIRKEQQRISHGRISGDARERLKKIASKKFRTCFISALAEFENVFGLEIWGHDLPTELLTSEQKVNREKWDKVRKNILDKGNAQLRALRMEIDLHKIDFEGYRMTFTGGKQNGQ